MTSVNEFEKDDDALAGEYVLRLLFADEHAAFAKRLRSDADLRDKVAAWDNQLVALSNEVEDVMPPAKLKGKIESRIFNTNDTAQKSRTFRWLVPVGLFSSLAIAAVIAFTVLPRSDIQLGSTQLVELQAGDQSLFITAQIDLEAGILDINRNDQSPGVGRDFELWLIVDGATAPISLGLIPKSGTGRIEVAQTLVAQLSGATLAISDEPEGGSPTGAPTGQVLATGVITS